MYSFIENINTIIQQIMKKLFYLFVLLAALSFSLSSCQQMVRQQLEDALEEVTKECPLESAVSTVHSMLLNGDMVEVKVSFRQDFYNFEVLQSNQDILRELMTLNLAAMLSSDEYEDFASIIKAAGVGFRYICCGPNASDRITVDVPVSEVDAAIEMAKDPIELTRQSLHVDIALSNKSLPIKVDSYTLLTHCFYEGDLITYEYEIIGLDEMMADYECREVLHSFLQGTTEENMEQTIQGNELDAALFQKIYVAGASLHYLYKSQNGYSFSFTISNERLGEMF